LDEFDHLAVFRSAHDAVEIVTDASDRLQDSVADAVRFWESTVESERAVNQEAQARRDQRIGFGLAGLALATAFPLIVGGSDWPALEHEIESWPSVFGWIGRALIAFHTPLTIAAVALAAALMIFLGAVLAYGIGRSAVARSALPEIGPMIQDVKDLNASVAVTADGERFLDAGADVLCAERLVDIWAWINERARARVQEEDSAERLAIDVDLLIASMELLDSRPTEVAGVFSACCFYFGALTIIDTGIFSREELLTSLGAWANPNSVAEALIDQHDELLELANRQPRRLLPRLRELGVGNYLEARLQA
jgi:hypothetical protein